MRQKRLWRFWRLMPRYDLTWAANAKYKADANNHQCKKVFQECDLVMVHQRWIHFPDVHTTLERCKYGQFVWHKRWRTILYALASRKLEYHPHIQYGWSVWILFRWWGVVKPNSRTCSFLNEGDWRRMVAIGVTFRGHNLGYMCPFWAHNIYIFEACDKTN